MCFFLDYLEFTEKPLPLHCVFHSIRFKVNKGWVKALTLFFAHTSAFISAFTSR